MNPDPVFSTLVALLEHRAQHEPQQRAYTFLLDGEQEEEHLTHAGLARRAQAIAATLQRRGVGPGDRALLLYPPGLDYISAFFGCLYAGVVAVPIYPPNPSRLDRTLPRLQAIIEDAQPTIALTDSFVLSMMEFLPAQVPDFPQLPWLAVDDEPGDEEGWRTPTLEAGSLAFLQYTSGSTGHPKGVMLSHANLLHNLALIYDCFELEPGVSGVIWLPPYHDMGLIGGILQPLYARGHVALMSPLDFLKRPLRWLQAIDRFRAGASGGPNFAYDLCVRKTTPEQRAALDLSCWQLAFNGAEPVRVETMERFATAFAPCGFQRQAFFPCYGLAEATLIVTGSAQGDGPVSMSVNRPALENHRVEAVPPTAPEAQTVVGSGRILTGQQVVIADPQTLATCLPDRVGEIWVAGPSVAQGYWQRDEESRQVFQARLADTDQGPFLRTGDLGFMHGGELFVTGRVKDLIIIRGRNLYPQDIEATVEACHPALRPGGGAAFSVDVADEERLVVVQEVNRGAEFDADEVMAAIQAAVSEEHDVHIHAIQLLEPGSIPKTSSGKIQRHACREGYLAQELESVAGTVTPLVAGDAGAENGQGEGESFIRRALAGMEDGAARRTLLTVFLQEQIARALQIPPAQVDTGQPVANLGLDSMSAVELQFELESNLGVFFTLDDVADETTVAGLAQQLLTRMESNGRGTGSA